MEEAVFEIDGSAFDDFAGFIKECNRSFCSHFGATWSGNLDAFNDFLSWPGHRYVLRWKCSGQSQDRLGHAEMAKRLAEQVRNCHPNNVTEMERRLNAARRHEGRTLFDELVEIIRENSEFVELRLE